MNSQSQTGFADLGQGRISRQALSDFSDAWAQYRKSMRAENPVFDSARNGDVDSLRMQIPSLSDLEEKNAKGYTLLMLAAYNGREEAVRFLISIGADVNSTDLGGNSILMGAAFKGHAKIVELLLQAGADKNYKNSKGQDAFQFSNLFGRMEVSALLEDSSSNQNRTRTRVRFDRFLSFLKSWILFLSQLTKGEKQ
ncbi:ankyrin repeat domain-containing protein [Leptospira kmetyi]|uniref:Ankyrin repeat domain-containing protein n=1 Tax=Leptospira kmetyi TaxID=408139 RepID=A0AAD0XNK0_9LEPT|nr:ankyrin repeat domain-containing protein [Leptospira kmetyi]AYV54097.1 ankyrin repeat domain-containing protein [Leptospira kmetyi]TGL69292.1 ankyrin repeat domain-containing protein [Leptospira kmetyi]